MKRRSCGALLIGLSTLALPLEASIYQHVDPLTGAITYSNFPPRRQMNEQATPDTSRTERPLIQKGSRIEAATAKSPANFPKVSAAVQKERDIDRRTILNDELQSEQNALIDAIVKKAADDIVLRHKANIAALKREIGNLK